MKVLVVGGGGREHALADALAASRQVSRVVVGPGNPGIGRFHPRVELDLSDPAEVANRARDFDLVVVGPEAPLAAGLGDALRAEKVPVLGPSRAAARLESSKAFAKEVMQACGVPTGAARRHEQLESALEHVRSGGPWVVKADGLAAGKGVVVADDTATAEAAVHRIFDGAFGKPVALIEERLTGFEVSVLALVDGHRCCVLPTARDHKRVGDGDRGPNTGGMGACSPAPGIGPEFADEVRRTCIEPVVAEMERRNSPFVGVLYAGLMVTPDGPKVLEYNVRFGDPEAQSVLPRLADDPAELMLAAARGSLQTERAESRPEASATVVLAAEGYPGPATSGDVIHGLDEARATRAHICCAAVAEQDGNLVTAGGRVLSVTGLGSGLDPALAQAYAAVNRICFRGMHYRTDIGRTG